MVRTKLFFLKIISANPVAELISEKKNLFKSFPETFLKSEQSYLQDFDSFNRLCDASVALEPQICLICEVYSIKFIQ